MKRLASALVLGAVLASMLSCSKPAVLSAGGDVAAVAKSQEPARSAVAGAAAPVASKGRQMAIGSQTPYGVNDWNWTDEAMLTMKDAGITWMRVMVDWSHIEANQGAQVWNKGANDNIDFYMSQAEKYGMQVSVVPYISPAWARVEGSSLPYPQAYADFVTSLLNRYQGRIAAVEILNEENTGAWPRTGDRDAVFYVPILQAAYDAAKQANPGILVATSGMWTTPEGYLEDLYALGAKGYFDVVNFHYYPGKRPPSEKYTWWIRHLRSVMERNGEWEKPIWLTEFAWTTTDENRGDKGDSIVTPQEQSDNLTYVLDASMKSGFVERVFWYVLRDDDGMALMHATDKYGWRTAQPPLADDIGLESTALTVAGDWTKRWPASGVLVVDEEQIAYSSLAVSSGKTSAQVAVRGAAGTPTTDHYAGTAVFSQSQTANSRRDVLSTYANFIQQHPSWEESDVAPLPDVAGPASQPVAIVNPGFENGEAGWSAGLRADFAEARSGSASARVENRTGKWERPAQRNLPVEPGTSYLLKGWVKIDPAGSGSMSAMIMADLLDSNGKFLALAPNNYYVYDTRGDWREIHHPFKTPADATQIAIYLSTDKGTGTAWFDDISVEPYDVTSR